jgi:hypothetical protein
MTTTYAIEKLRAEVGELLAKHAAAQDILSFAKYAGDPVGFFHDVLRCEPWSKQIEMAELVRDHPRVVRNGERAGQGLADRPPCFMVGVLQARARHTHGAD